MKYYYEVLVYEDMPKKSLVELAEGMECWKGVCKVTILEEDVAALRARVEALEAAGAALFQSCADLPLPEMDRMENEINAMAAALK